MIVSVLLMMRLIRVEWNIYRVVRCPDFILGFGICITELGPVTPRIMATVTEWISTPRIAITASRLRRTPWIITPRISTPWIMGLWLGSTTTWADSAYSSDLLSTDSTSDNSSGCGDVAVTFFRCLYTWAASIALGGRSWLWSCWWWCWLAWFFNRLFWNWSWLWFWNRNWLWSWHILS